MTDYDKKLQEAIAARDKFLQDNPHLAPFQQEINGVLDKVPTQSGRMEALSIMMSSHVLGLSKELTNLSNVVLDITAGLIGSKQ